jgi:glycerol-3-phosphate acyltransferase PlsY
LGSVPFAFLLARRRGVDLRRAGSGNVGATNVLRTSGVPSAVAAMSLDAVKGAVAVVVAQQMTNGPVGPVAAGLASIVGHIYPIWLRFRGGKGVATSAGVFAVLAPVALGAASAVFLVAVWITRYISVGSLAGAITLTAVASATRLPTAVIVGAFAAALIIGHRHRENLSRIRQGTERRIGQRLVSAGMHD